MHETKEAGVYVAGLREDIVSSPEQVMELLEGGERHRHCGETRMNKNSSRSHTVFRMVVESRSRDTNPDDAQVCGGGGGRGEGQRGAGARLWRRAWRCVLSICINPPHLLACPPCSAHLPSPPARPRRTLVRSACRR